MKRTNFINKKISEQSGITLIALVLTIIILLILAGVAVATLTGDNGLLQKAGEAKNTTIEAEGLEKIQLAVMASHDNRGINTTSLAKNLSQIIGVTDLNSETITENTPITLPIVINMNDTKYMINEEGDVLKPDYCKNGLMLHLDGINNTRNGHSTTTTIWEDLSGNNNDFTKLSGALDAKWSDNSFVGDNKRRSVILNKAILENSNECTVEICYDVPELKNNAYDGFWVFQSRQNNSPANGFQFVVAGHRSLELFNSISNNSYNVFSNLGNDTKKRTISFALNYESIIFSNNAQFCSQTPVNGLVESIVQRDLYTIGSGYPWHSCNFSGNIYSIRVYNRKLSDNELKLNYLVDKLRFNMD